MVFFAATLSAFLIDAIIQGGTWRWVVAAIWAASVSLRVRYAWSRRRRPL